MIIVTRKATEFRFGTITGKNVIYRGKSGEMDGIHYINVEEYLKSLCKNIDFKMIFCYFFT